MGVLLKLPVLDSDNRLWIFIILGITIAVTILVNVLSGGFIFKYTKSKIRSKTKETLVTVHFLASIILAISLPNMVLKDYQYFENLYRKSEAMIPITMILILFVMLLLLGIVFSTIAVYLDGKRNVEN
jgi:hypothetical protein